MLPDEPPIDVMPVVVAPPLSVIPDVIEPLSVAMPVVGLPDVPIVVSPSVVSIGPSSGGGAVVVIGVVVVGDVHKHGPNAVPAPLHSCMPGVPAQSHARDSPGVHGSLLLDPLLVPAVPASVSLPPESSPGQPVRAKSVAKHIETSRMDQR